MKMRGSIFMRLYHFYKVSNRRSSCPIFFRGCAREKTGQLYRVIKISLLLTIILTGCATPPTIVEYDGTSERDKVFNNIAQEIIKSKKRTIAIIAFTNFDGKKIEEGEDVVEDMALFLNQRIGIEKVWVESGKSLMNVLEKQRIIENGKITNKEQAKRLWLKMGIEVVITGILDPHPNWMGYLIELHDVQDDKMIRQFNGIWQGEDAITMKGTQTPESTGTSRGAWAPPTPSDYEKISQHFLNSHKHATLADVGNALQAALKNEGFKTTYFAVPEGFALVSSADDFRFSLAGIPPPNATKGSNALNLLKALKKDFWKTSFKIWILGSPEQQFYQVVSVIVTSGDVWEQRQMKFKEARNLIGGATIPEALKNQEYNEEKYKCMALLYAFEKDPSGDEIRFISLNDTDNPIHIRKHLQQTGFWDNP